MNHLQKIIDFAVANGYEIKYSLARKRASFRNKTTDHRINTALCRSKDDADIWVWFDDESSGMSGNDPDYEFLQTFKRLKLGHESL